VIDGRVVEVTRTDDGRFRLELTGGHTVYARRVLAATGLIDELPDIEGVAEHWGGDVIHCPFCHGFEVRDQRIVQIITNPMGLHPAGLFRHLSDRLTLVLHDGVAADVPAVEALRTAGVRIIDTRVQRIVTGDDGHVVAVELLGGDSIEADAVVVSTRFRVGAEPFSSLGLALEDHPSGLGQVVSVDHAGATSVPGLFAAGNVTDPSQQVLGAAANGSWVGAMISSLLAHEDINAAARPSANETDWDHRYDGDQIWSGNPNGTLVREIGGRTPGTALDVGAGEGGDRGIANLIDAVAPSGTLLVVGHDLAPMRIPIDPHEHSRPFDPDAFVRADDVAAVLTGSPDWDIEVHETRPRPPGSASAQHHVDDVVLRARRRTP